MMRPFLLGLLLSGCAGEPVDEGTCGQDAGDPQSSLVITAMRFARVEAGQSAGFDLDQRVSALGDVETCGRADSVDAAGNTGIDNAFGSVLPALEGTEFIAVEGLIQQTINDGTLLLLVTMGGDDGGDDACMSWALRRGQGLPYVGHDGQLEPYQTFELSDAQEPVEVSEAARANGEMEVSGVTVSLPLQIFDVSFVFVMTDAHVRTVWHDDGSVTGVLSGAVAVSDLIEVASSGNVDKALAGILEAALYAVSDLGRDANGVCQELSVGFEFEARPAYIYGEDT